MNLAKLKEGLILHFQVKPLYNEQELEALLETMERRGAAYRNIGDGRHQVGIPTEIPWIPFYKTLADCDSIRLTGVTTPSQTKTIYIEPEG